MGVGFCGSVDKEVRRSGNGSAGLGRVLEGVVWTDCKGLVSPDVTKNVGGVLKGIGHGVLVSSPHDVRLFLT